MDQWNVPDEWSESAREFQIVVHYIIYIH